VAWAYLQLGRVAQAEGDVTRAAISYRTSLASNARLGDKEIIARNLAELAALAGDQGQVRLAARWFGAAAALRDTLGAPYSPAELTRFETMVSGIRNLLDEPDFAEAWDEGRTLPVDRVIEEVETAHLH
jgi:hypothetical protein